jgi:exosortase E/protease (VPEID-CTERM system)
MTPATATTVSPIFYRTLRSPILRFGCLALLLVAELVGFSLLFDTQAIDGKPGLTGILADDGPVIVNGLLAFAGFFVAFSYSKAKPLFQKFCAETAPAGQTGKLLATHFLTLAAFFWLTTELFASRLTGDAVVVGWLLLGLVQTALAVFAFFPLSLCVEIVRTTGFAWLCAAGGSVSAMSLLKASRLLWGPTTEATFQCLRILLGLFSRNLVVHPATKTIGTSTFSVTIAPACSGLEGLGLMLAFSLVWLWISRNEVILSRAVAIIPIIVAAMFPLNVLRIASLILIGNAGAPSIAVGGFHSQAGWIVFNSVAIGFCFAANRVSWLWKREQTSVPQQAAQSNPTAAYLVPFLAILGASMISRATQANFEWLYPLRFVAAAGSLVFLRREYRNLNWRCGWIAPAIGVVVFALWMALDRFAAPSGENGIAKGLAALPMIARVIWLTFRVLTAVIIVPIAEELAFRGYLARRLVSSHFESVAFQQYSWIAILISSIAFGAMHGDRWFAGIVAGILYAFAAKKQGRIGDAVVAHGVTNALIAVWVLVGGHWSLW